MKALNHKQIQRGYWKFSLVLMLCVFIGVAIFYVDQRTREEELNRIIEKTQEYDRINAMQLELIDRIDTLYQYMLLFNTDKNDVALQLAISRRKQEILSSMEDMDDNDVKIYRQLMSQINIFLGAKDSIRIIKIKESRIRRDLNNCIEEYKHLSRKVTIENIQSQ